MESAEQVIAALGLTPAQTCGFTRISYTSELATATLPAPFDTPRPVGTALYFLVTPEAPVRPHRIRNDQLYHYYRGVPLELVLLHEDGVTERVTMGPDVLAGQQLQFCIPGGTFHTARVGGGWFLGGSTEWPGVLPADVELGDVEVLAQRHPDVADTIRHNALA
jgi:predicted cupin superfamily sugar epimerase